MIYFELYNLISELKGESSINNNKETMNHNAEEEEEKQRLIERVLELQSTLDDLSKKVNDVKEENFKLKSENQILSSYIENLMSTSSVFQSAWQKQSLNKK